VSSVSEGNRPFAFEEHKFSKMQVKRLLLNLTTEPTVGARQCVAVHSNHVPVSIASFKNRISPRAVPV
jgi:hypothetical protein